MKNELCREDPPRRQEMRFTTARSAHGDCSHSIYLDDTCLPPKFVGHAERNNSTGNSCVIGMLDLFSIYMYGTCVDRPGCFAVSLMYVRNATQAVFHSGIVHTARTIQGMKGA